MRSLVSFIGVLGAVCTFALASSASAMTCDCDNGGTYVSSNGGYYRGSGNDDASRANLTGTATLTDGLATALVTVQNLPPTSSPSKALQIGTLKEILGFSSDCGTDTIGIAVERVVNGSYFCDIYFGEFGYDYKFAVVRSSDGWRGYVNDSAIDGPWNLSMTGGYSVARAEAHWSSYPPDYSFTWGPSGETPWQYRPSGGSYTTINSATAFSSSDWSASSLPSPFTITKR